MVFSIRIHTKHHRTFLHNSRELEIALGLISCMVDRNVAFMTELYNVVVYRRIIGGCNDEEELDSIPPDPARKTRDASKPDAPLPQASAPELFCIPKEIFHLRRICLAVHTAPAQNPLHL